MREKHAKKRIYKLCYTVHGRGQAYYRDRGVIGRAAFRCREVWNAAYLITLDPNKNFSVLCFSISAFWC